MTFLDVRYIDIKTNFVEILAFIIIKIIKYMSIYLIVMIELFDKHVRILFERLHAKTNEKRTLYA